MKPIRAGDFRHVIAIQRRTETEDPVTGYRTWVWADLLAGIPAAWLSGPGREYLASEAKRAETQGRLTVRWSPAVADVTAADRVLWDGNVYDLKADPLVDPTARREVTLMVARGVNDGD